MKETGRQRPNRKGRRQKAEGIDFVGIYCAWSWVFIHVSTATHIAQVGDIIQLELSSLDHFQACSWYPFGSCVSLKFGTMCFIINESYLCGEPGFRRSWQPSATRPIYQRPDAQSYPEGPD